MATKNTPTTFYELDFAGPEDLVHGFVTGLMMGAGHDGLIIHCPDEDIAGPSFKDKVKAVLHVHPNEVNVVVDGATRSLVKKHAKKMFAETGLELIDDHKVRRAQFEFAYEAYAPRYGREIDALMKSFPTGLKIVNRERDENLDPSAKGVETYAAVHHYELKGSGKIIGRFDLVLQARRTLDTHPLVKVDELKLELV
jgi:hypothetical protein